MRGLCRLKTYTLFRSSDFFFFFLDFPIWKVGAENSLRKVGWTQPETQLNRKPSLSSVCLGLVWVQAWIYNSNLSSDAVRVGLQLTHCSSDHSLILPIWIAYYEWKLIFMSAKFCYLPFEESPLCFVFKDYLFILVKHFSRIGLAMTKSYSGKGKWKLDLTNISKPDAIEPCFTPNLYFIF